MSLKSLLYILPLLLACLIANAKTEEFRVSKVGADKTELLKVFAAVQKLEAGEPQAFEVLQRISSTEYLVYALKWNAYSRTFGEADLTKLYWLKLSTPRGFVSNDTITGIFTESTGSIRTYETALGSSKSVREYQEIEPAMLTQDEFVSLLRMGRTWTLRIYRFEKCSRCFGDGKLSALQGNARCPDCHGRGIISIDLLVCW